MKEKLNGLLSYNSSSWRYEIIFDDGTRRELHCGDVFDAFIEDEWRTVRIEFDSIQNRWFLVGYTKVWLNGLKVRY